MSWWGRILCLLFFLCATEGHIFAQYSGNHSGYSTAYYGRSYAVDTSKVDTGLVYLFTKYGDATVKSEYADYYRTYKLIHEDPKVFRIKEYWMNGIMRRSYTCEGASFLHRMGEYKVYNRKGILTFIAHFDNQQDQYGINRQVGVVTYYHDNGLKRLEDEYRKGKFCLLSYWDSTGVQRVTDGNGYCTYDIKGSEGTPDFRITGKVKNYNYDSVWTGILPNGDVYCIEE